MKAYIYYLIFLLFLHLDLIANDVRMQSYFSHHISNYHLEDVFVKTVQSSRQSIDLHVYHFDDSPTNLLIELSNAQRRGVRVRILINGDDDGSFLNSYSLSNWANSWKTQASFNPISNWARDFLVDQEIKNKVNFAISHSKYLIADPFTQGKVIITSANLTKKGLNSSSQDLIVLQDYNLSLGLLEEFEISYGIKEVYEIEKSKMMWEKYQLSDRYTLIKNTDYFSDIRLYLLPDNYSLSWNQGQQENNFSQTLISEINQAESQILISIFTFTSEPLKLALEAALKRGVQVHIICDERQANLGYSQIPLLTEKVSGITFKGISSTLSQWHHKYIFIDPGSQNLLYTGSANYTEAGFNYNDEVVFSTKDKSIGETYFWHFYYHHQHQINIPANYLYETNHWNIPFWLELREAKFTLPTEKYSIGNIEEIPQLYSKLKERFPYGTMTLDLVFAKGNSQIILTPNKNLKKLISFKSFEELKEYAKNDYWKSWKIFDLEGRPAQLNKNSQVLLLEFNDREGNRKQEMIYYHPR